MSAPERKSNGIAHLAEDRDQVAFALARPGYVLGERILAEVEPFWPRQACCTPADEQS